MASVRRSPVIQNTKSGDFLEVAESKCYLGRDDADSPVMVYLSSLSMPNIAHCELRAGLGVLVLLPLEFCLVDSKKVSINHPVVLTGHNFKLVITSSRLLRFPGEHSDNCPRFLLRQRPIRMSHICQCICSKTFVHEYEDCHKQKSTDCNPRPGDDVVCILLCELVKLCQAITELEASIPLWLKMLVVFATNSSCICLLLILAKFLPTLMALVCMSGTGIATSETCCISCTLLSLLVTTQLPRGHKLPIGKGFLHVVIHRLDQGVCYSSLDCDLVMSLCELLLCVVTAATTWWLDVSTTGPAILVYLQHMAIPVLQKVTNCFASDEKVLSCVSKVKGILAEKQDVWGIHIRKKTNQSGKVAILDHSDVIIQRNVSIPVTRVLPNAQRNATTIESGDDTNRKIETELPITGATVAARYETEQKTLVTEGNATVQVERKVSKTEVAETPDAEILIADITVQTGDGRNESVQSTPHIPRPTLASDNNETKASVSGADVQRGNGDEAKSLEAARPSVKKEQEVVLCSIGTEDFRHDHKENSFDSLESSLKTSEPSEKFETSFEKQLPHIEKKGITTLGGKSELTEVCKTEKSRQNSVEILDRVMTDGFHGERTSNVDCKTNMFETYRQSPSSRRKGWTVSPSNVSLYGVHSQELSTDKVEDAIDELHSHHSSVLTTLRERFKILQDVVFEVSNRSYQPLMSFLVVNKVDETTLLDVLSTLLFNGVPKAQWDIGAIKQAVTVLTPIIASPGSRHVIRACEVVQALVGVYSNLQMSMSRSKCSSGTFKGHSQEQYDECQRSLLDLRNNIADDSRRVTLANLSPGQTQDDYVLAKHALLLHLSNI
ncbi:uncharacterized protein LOC134189703 isoform X2 [Corticium candelabrum]|uniref:uncharacterized protein LOC134189703 isoform X2 n=1 Tax=Corticium candelabrum TaxID=121492 RepID=UPI002E2572DA|nr:uncharacterized protein LOC134189703 isoform X2 [Corticium candelabrum]